VNYLIIALLSLLALVLAWGYHNKRQIANLLRQNRDQVVAEAKAVELKAVTFWQRIKGALLFWRK
jgi:hypothetical protein